MMHKSRARNFFKEPCPQVVLQTVCNTSAGMALFFQSSPKVCLHENRLKNKFLSSVFSLDKSSKRSLSGGLCSVLVAGARSIVPYKNNANSIW